MSTFKKIYKKVANNGDSNDYQEVGTVGVNGVNLDIMRGANSSSAGEIGLVPKPSAGDNNRYLRSDGTWAVPPDTNNTYDVFAGSNNGLVPATDKGTYFLTGNGSWGYPWIGSWSESGKMIICLGSGDDQLSKNELPEATSSANGLMSAAICKKLKLILPAKFYIAYIDKKITVGTVTKGTVKSFNTKLVNKVYQKNYPHEYDIYKAIREGYMDLKYEPRFMGCSYGNIIEFSNGSDTTMSFGSDANGDYCIITYYVQGKVMNTSDGDHTMTVNVTTDFYAIFVNSDV
jgi:hypothetical protein